ncbi:MAG: hypothetical protein MI892_14920 [Desulfobacterales bacterium]|nr:hypothetical protein [Desulfobacterales bacterium]
MFILETAAVFFLKNTAAAFSRNKQACAPKLNAIALWILVCCMSFKMVIPKNMILNEFSGVQEASGMLKSFHKGQYEQHPETCKT